MRKRYLIVLLISVSVISVLVGCYGTDTSAKRLINFTSTAYGASLQNQLNLSIEIVNSLPQDGDYNIPRGYQPLTLYLRLHNSSLLQWRKVQLALRFSETVADYLELREPGAIVNVGVLQPASEWETAKVYFIPEFNGDRDAVGEVAKLLSSPIMAQVSAQDKVDILLIAPDVNLAVPSSKPHAERTLDQWGDLTLTYQETLHQLCVRNTAMGTETTYSGITGFFTSDGDLVALKSDGSVVLYQVHASPRQLMQGILFRPPLQFDLAREQFAMATMGENLEALIVYDLTSDVFYTLPIDQGSKVIGWAGERILLGRETSLGLRLEIVSLDGVKVVLDVGGLPTPLGTPVWDPEHRYFAYGAAGNRVVVVDVLHETSQLIPDATEPVWTSLGLHVTFESIGRVIRY